MEGIGYCTYGNIEINNNNNQQIKTFFVDFNINGNYFKCENTDYTIMRYVDEFIAPQQSKYLKVKWDILDNYNKRASFKSISGLG